MAHDKRAYGKHGKALRWKCVELAIDHGWDAARIHAWLTMAPGSPLISLTCVKSILKIYDDTGDVLWLRNHPVRLFDVMGVVVGLHPRAPSLANCGERVTFTLDDSTGLVECVLWLHEWSGEGAGREKRPRPQAEVAAELDALRLGALVHVHGTFRRFRDSRQLSVERLWREADPNAECVHWLRCRELWRKCYSVDFTIPQAVRQLEAARKGHKHSVEKLRERIVAQRGQEGKVDQGRVMALERRAEAVRGLVWQSPAVLQ